MTREEFISELNQNIKDISDHNEIIYYYFELISDKMESGMTEEEAVASLGDMDTIIKNIVDNSGDDVEFKEEPVEPTHIVETIETKNEEPKKETSGNKELSGGKKFVLVLWKIATVLFCIAAMSLYVLSIILVGVAAALLTFGIYEMTGLFSYGAFFFGLGLFILGAALAGIYYTRFLRQFMFGNRLRWNEMIRVKLAGE